MSKTMQYVMKGITIVAALLAALLLIAPFMTQTVEVMGKSVTEGANLFDAWDAGLEHASADFVIMVICYSIVFFLGLIMAVLALVGMFAKGDLIDKILKIAGIVLAVLAIVGLICNFVYVNSFSSGDAVVASYQVAIGVGGILSAIFSVIAAAMVYAEKALK